ncbi:MAG TPA: putative peptide maturation dehydrogenase, partial [Thermoanaerobaculia bacterium]|nr:putative peptide maturation dehydrogenase [Thermoanaerobaculia bacterium]
MRVRRPKRVHFFAETRDHLDLDAFLTGSVEIVQAEGLYGASPLTGREEPVSPEEMAGLLRIPSGKWMRLSEAARESGIEADRLRELVASGMLLADGADPQHRAVRERAARLSGDGWDPYAALYHGMARWEGGHEHRSLGDLDRTLAASRRWFEEQRERLGPPPTHFHQRSDAMERIGLPRASTGGSLFELLDRRRTDRDFDRSRPLGLEELSTLLYAVYGFRGMQDMGGGVVALRRTSPSGGALHPIEAYPLVRDVEGLPPGLYHYSVGRHELELLRPMPRDEVEDRIEEIAAGQSYFRSAHAAVVLTARFGRTFWKYRHHKKAYRVVLLDTGHLS